MRIVIRILVLLVIVLLGVRLLEKRSIYFPMRKLRGNPSDMQLEYQEIYFNTADNKKIQAWFIPNKNAELTILFSNGNAGNISYRLEKISILHDLGVNIFIYDYRGYGRSQGSPSESGLYRDIRGAYDYLVNNLGVSSDKIVLYGESLGGAVAIDLASQKPVRALITEGTFASVKEMARKILPFIPTFIYASRFDNLTKIADIDCEKLIIHSKDDRIIPFSQGKSLFKAASQPKILLKLKGGHNTSFLDSAKEYRQGIKSFLESL